ncbi:MAG: hypothetical protein WBD20_19735 [Pirellulaceae bacterium]
MNKILSNPFQICQRFWWSRYAILTIFSPALIVAAAWGAPSFLRGLLLLHGTQPTAMDSDLLWLTWISGMLVALGLAIYRMIGLHGPARMLDKHESAQDLPAHQLTDENQIQPFQFEWTWNRTTVGWPMLPTLVWIALTITYPLAAGYETVSDLISGGAITATTVGETTLWRSAMVSTVKGVGFAAATLFGLALLRTLCFSGRPGAGLIFGEGIAFWLVNKTPWGSKNLSFSPRLPLRLRGFTDDKKQLLPGHGQLLLNLIASLAVYSYWYIQSMQNETWHPGGWPVGFYALLLIYCLSAFGCLLAFFLDRFRFPLIIVVALYLVVASRLNDTNRYFQLVAEGPGTLPASDDLKTPHLFVDALANRPAENQYLDPPYLYDLYDKDFHFPIWPDGKRTLVVVSASGGGIQAAGWTSRVLTSLEKELPVLSESIGLASGVSGGSVGLLQYLAHRGPRKNDPDGKQWMQPDEKQLATIHTQATASSLEAVGWGLAFPDFTRRAFPFPVNKEIDRGWALEASWWNRMGRTPDDALWMKELRIRDLIAPTIAGQFPPVIFNATAVETGQRVLISPVRAFAVPPDDGQHPDYHAIDTPIDFLDFYGSAMSNPQSANPRVSTAVRLSATFAYVTPVAKPLQLRDDQINHESEELESRLDMHLCDGGYADNTGLVSAIRIIQDLIHRYQKDLEVGKQPPFERILFLRIEPFPENMATVVRDNTGLKTALLGPFTALTATRTSTQAERAELELSLLMDVSSQVLKIGQEDLAMTIQTKLNHLKATTDSNAIASIEGLETLKTEIAKFRTLVGQVQDVRSAAGGDIKPNRELGIQIRRIKSEIRDDTIKTLPPETSRVIKSIAGAIDDYDKAIKRSLNLPSAIDQSGEPIEIKTALFRFDTRNRPDDPSQSNSGSSHAPPLSWRLAATDLLAIEDAWQGIEREFNQNTDVGSAADADTYDADAPQTWQSSNEKVRRNTFRPSQLLKKGSRQENQ